MSPPMKSIMPYLVSLVVLVSVLTFVGFYVLLPRKNVKLAMVQCPYCDVVEMYGVTKHDPAGVSHTEVLYCANCYRNFVVRVYYDGVITVVTPR